MSCTLDFPSKLSLSHLLFSRRAMWSGDRDAGVLSNNNKDLAGGGGSRKKKALEIYEMDQ